MKRTAALNLILFLLLIGAAQPLSAQQFSIDTFRTLPNDISAFIEPVKDRNEDDCALLKVAAPEDFAFSTPLGIVKRIDKTGEIWLYIPRRSKKITLKHPRFGIIRDYIFPDKIESHMTYELKLVVPEEVQTINSPQFAQPEIVRDTLIVTRTDTLRIVQPKVRIPFTLTVTATLAFGGNSGTPLPGLMIAGMRRHGAFIHASSDFGLNVRSRAKCDKEGAIGPDTPFYTGRTRNSAFQISAGAIHRLSTVLRIFEGIGYGSNSRYWEIAQSDGGGYAKNSHFSYKGVLIEAGLQLRLHRLAISASAVTIEGRQWFGSIGAGYIF